MYILGILMQWFLLWNTFTTKHVPRDKNYEWNIPNVHECYGSQCETSMTVAETMVWKFSSEQAGHTTQSAMPLCPWESLVLSHPSCRRGSGSGRCPESGVLRTSLVMECGTVDRKEGWAGGWASISYEVRNRQLELKDIGREQEYLVTDTRILFSQTCQCLKEFAQVQVSQTSCAFCPAVPPLWGFSDPSLGLLLSGS